MGAENEPLLAVQRRKRVDIVAQIGRLPVVKNRAAQSNQIIGAKRIGA